MTENRTGGCQCGRIRYAVTGEPRLLVVCHCTDCQRQSGSAFGMSLVVAVADFRVLEGEPRSFELRSEAGRGKRGVFCPDCGTRLYHETEFRKGSVSVKAGTLDDTSGLRPDMHIWTDSRQPWVSIPDGVEHHPRQP